MTLYSAAPCQRYVKEPQANGRDAGAVLLRQASTELTVRARSITECLRRQQLLWSLQASVSLTALLVKHPEPSVVQPV